MSKWMSRAAASAHYTRMAAKAEVRADALRREFHGAPIGAPWEAARRRLLSELAVEQLYRRKAAELDSPGPERDRAILLARLREEELESARGMYRPARGLGRAATR